jgi:hypothetical protein
MEINPNKAIQYLMDTAPLYAQAKANRMYLEEMRKSVKAKLMKGCQETVLGKQEIYAYAHPDYIQILEGIKAVVEQEENYRWMMAAAQARVEVWKTQEFSKRAEARNVG